MVKRIKAWLERNKDELLIAWGTLITGVSIILAVYSIAMTIMTKDLLQVTEENNNKLAESIEVIDTLTYERNYYYGLYDDIIQTYEQTVPLQQYIEDIEFLESVILELRYQCELECETYNNKEN